MRLLYDLWKDKYKAEWPSTGTTTTKPSDEVDYFVFEVNLSDTEIDGLTQELEAIVETEIDSRLD